jgi:glutamate synthase (NADPH/NADH) large chain
MRVNPDTLTWQRLLSPHWETVLRGFVEQHARETNSRYAAMLLHDWEIERDKFWQVVPREFVKYLAQPLQANAQALRA